MIYEHVQRARTHTTNHRAKGGTNDIENLQFLSWFENRCKNDMTQTEWNNLKLNIQEYFI
jgi:hypothetical protein